MMRKTLLLGLALALAAASCRYDPTAQDVVDGLGDEKGTPSATHRPGEPCLACHSTYEGAKPAFAVAGTIYGLDASGKKIVPAANIMVNVLDSAGSTRKACTNSAGNFYVLKEDWDDIKYPLTPVAATTQMQSLVGRDGSCASCHKLPDKSSLNPLTGAGRDSAGVILVDTKATDPRCLKEAK